MVIPNRKNHDTYRLCVQACFVPTLRTHKLTILLHYGWHVLPSDCLSVLKDACALHPVLERLHVFQLSTSIMEEGCLLIEVFFLSRSISRTLANHSALFAFVQTRSHLSQLICFFHRLLSFVSCFLSLVTSALICLTPGCFSDPSVFQLPKRFWSMFPFVSIWVFARCAMRSSSAQALHHHTKLSVRIVSGMAETFLSRDDISHVAGAVPYFPYFDSPSWSWHNYAIPYLMAECFPGCSL